LDSFVFHGVIASVMTQSKSGRERNPATMTTQTGDQRITVHSEAAASIHDDGIVILQTRTGLLFSSNRTGASIWRCIEEKLPFEEIAQKICREYQIGGSVAREHTARFLTELEKQSLIEKSLIGRGNWQ
jgi:Coenzyme PQQ synthesis protein D (PqqD)